MGYLSHLETRFGGARVPAAAPAGYAGTDGDFLEARYDLGRARAELERDAIARGPASLWRYAALLPVADPARAVSLGEGWTPLLPAPALSRRLGLASLHVKDEGRNPSGTFKDRGASVALSRYRELGVGAVVHNSSGNAAAAWALYAARAGIRCVNLVAADALPSCLQQAGLAGAETYLVRAPWQRSGGLVRELASRFGWLNVATLKEPYRLEGKKTMGYEIAEQLGWELPDVVVYPTGGGLGPIAIFKAFAELVALGWVRPPARPPRLLVTQYEGCAPIVKAWREGKARAETWPAITSPPGGLKGAAPPGDRAVLRLLAETGGGAVAVSTEDAIAAAREMAAAEGLFPAPESATTLAGLRRAIADGTVDVGERIVLLCTGSGLKSTPVLPLVVPPEINTADDVPARPAPGA